MEPYGVARIGRMRAPGPLEIDGTPGEDGRERRQDTAPPEGGRMEERRHRAGRGPGTPGWSVGTRAEPVATQKEYVVLISRNDPQIR